MVKSWKKKYYKGTIVLYKSRNQSSPVMSNQWVHETINESSPFHLFSLILLLFFFDIFFLFGNSSKLIPSERHFLTGLYSDSWAVIQGKGKKEKPSEGMKEGSKAEREREREKAKGDWQLGGNWAAINRSASRALVVKVATTPTKNQMSHIYIFFLFFFFFVQKKKMNYETTLPRWEK